MEKTTIYLPRELRLALESASRATGQPRAELIRRAVHAYLEQQPALRPRSIGIVSDGTLDAAEIEDWLDAEWGRS